MPAEPDDPEATRADRTGSPPTSIRFASRFARFAYSTLLRIVIPAYVGKLWWRGRAEPAYRHAVGERFGLHETPTDSGRLWLHAVSLGETRAAAALIQALRVSRPHMRLLLTHGTATGLEAGRELLHAGDVQAWLPFDTPGAVRRFFRHFDPVVGVLMETEIWPNLLMEAHRRGMPMVLANARLSERSLRRGARFAAVLRPAMASLTSALAQTEDDAARLRLAGVSNVVVSGNLKFDMTVDAALLARGRAWRAALARPVVMAAATREGEEAMLVAAWQRLATTRADRPLLLVVPRHPQRFDEVAASMRASGMTVARRTGWIEDPPEEALRADAWVGDSMREMAQYYAAADVALLGGSFAPFGGQNLIEAAACGCPLVMGPSTFNFDQAARFAEAAGAASRATDFFDAVARALALIDDPVRAARMREASISFAAQHRGAADRMARDIADIVDDACLVRSNNDHPST